MRSCASTRRLLEGRLLATARAGTMIVVNSSRTPDRVRRGSCRATASFRSTASRFRAGTAWGASSTPPCSARWRGRSRRPTLRGADPHAHRGSAKLHDENIAACEEGFRTVDDQLRSRRWHDDANERPSRRIWTTGSTEVFKTGSWRAALPQHIHAPSPCHAACPVNGDIAEWIGRARARDFRGAWEVLTRHNPFPAVAGRICHHPCEAACNRAGFDDSLAICRLERHIGDMALAEGWAFAPVETSRARADRSRRRRAVGIVGRIPSAPARLRGHAARIPPGTRRTDALRHSGVSARALRARRRDRAHRGARRRRALRRSDGRPARTSSVCARSSTPSTSPSAPAARSVCRGSTTRGPG